MAKGRGGRSGAWGAAREDREAAVRCRLLFAAAWRCARSCLGALTAGCCVRTARRRVWWRRRRWPRPPPSAVSWGVGGGGRCTLPDGLPIQRMTVWGARGKGGGGAWSAVSRRAVKSRRQLTGHTRRLAAYAHMQIRTYQISRVPCSSLVCLGAGRVAAFVAASVRRPLCMWWWCWWWWRRWPRLWEGGEGWGYCLPRRRS